jgi:uncharacterized protein Usg
MTPLEMQLRDYRLTTAEITYHLPDYPAILQKFIWQEWDIAPKYPVLKKFLDFWEAQIEGRLHSVKIATAPLIQPAKLRLVRHQIQFH